MTDRAPINLENGIGASRLLPPHGVKTPNHLEIFRAGMHQSFSTLLDLFNKPSREDIVRAVTRTTLALGVGAGIQIETPNIVAQQINADSSIQSQSSAEITKGRFIVRGTVGGKAVEIRQETGDSELPPVEANAIPDIENRAVGSESELPNLDKDFTRSEREARFQKWLQRTEIIWRDGRSNVDANRFAMLYLSTFETAPDEIGRAVKVLGDLLKKQRDPRTQGPVQYTSTSMRFATAVSFGLADPKIKDVRLPINFALADNLYTEGTRPESTRLREESHIDFDSDSERLLREDVLDLNLPYQLARTVFIIEAKDTVMFKQSQDYLRANPSASNEELSAFLLAKRDQQLPIIIVEADRKALAATKKLYDSTPETPWRVGAYLGQFIGS